MVSNYSTGHEAEKRASDYLKKQGYKVRELNWRTRVCEIDIIAEKQNKIYFVEVKHRVTGAQGGGLDYITPKKLHQMQFAAECWVQEQNWSGDYELAAIELSGDQFAVTNFLPNIV